jgi:hypothetical protein
MRSFDISRVKFFIWPILPNDITTANSDNYNYITMIARVQHSAELSVHEWVEENVGPADVHGWSLDFSRKSGKAAVLTFDNDSEVIAFKLRFGLDPFE